MDGIFNSYAITDMMAMKELRPATVAKFNRINTNRKGVKFSILAGYTVRTTCQEWGLGDGVVQLPSALYNISDRDYSRNIHTELTGKDDFEKFVLPRLAVSPKKAKADRQIAQNESDANDLLAAMENASNDRDGFNSYFRNASFKPDEITDDESDAPVENLTTQQKVVLKGNEAKEIEIPVRDGKHAGVLLVASTAVAATLFDETGATVGKNIVDSPDAPCELFRVINADRAVKNGVWKLKLKNFGGGEQTIYLAGWTSNGASSAFTIEAGKPNAAGTIPLTAKLIENNQPVLNAKITASVVGQNTKIEFFDDGKHNDAAENDGIYGASVAKLAKGEYFIEAQAEVRNQTRNAVIMVTVTDANSNIKPAAKPRRKS